MISCIISPMIELNVPDIFAALELIEKPLRIVASLRK
jgi:hypothetical protein